MSDAAQDIIVRRGRNTTAYYRGLRWELHLEIPYLSHSGQLLAYLVVGVPSPRNQPCIIDAKRDTRALFVISYFTLALSPL